MGCSKEFRNEWKREKGEEWSGGEKKLMRTEEVMTKKRKASGRLETKKEKWKERMRQNEEELKIGEIKEKVKVKKKSKEGREK